LVTRANAMVLTMFDVHVRVYFKMIVFND
jgi:hypothetical protein